MDRRRFFHSVVGATAAAVVTPLPAAPASFADVEVEAAIAASRALRELRRMIITIDEARVAEGLCP